MARGRLCIYMRGILAAHAVKNRTVWVADSFAGLPKPDETLYPADKGDTHHIFDELSVSLDEVKDNFQRFGLLDEQVAFLPGWFKDTLPQAPIDQLAVLRLDGDMYGSTIETLQALYTGSPAAASSSSTITFCRGAAKLQTISANSEESKSRFTTWMGRLRIGGGLDSWMRLIAPIVSRP